MMNHDRTTSRWILAPLIAVLLTTWLLLYRYRSIRGAARAMWIIVTLFLVRIRFVRWIHSWQWIKRSFRPTMQVIGIEWLWEAESRDIYTAAVDRWLDQRKRFRFDAVDIKGPLYDELRAMLHSRPHCLFVVMHYEILPSNVAWYNWLDPNQATRRYRAWFPAERLGWPAPETVPASTAAAAAAATATATAKPLALLRFPSLALYVSGPTSTAAAATTPAEGWTRLPDEDYVLFTECNGPEDFNIEFSHYPRCHQWSTRRLRRAFPLQFGGSSLDPILYPLWTQTGMGVVAKGTQIDKGQMCRHSISDEGDHGP